MSIAHKPVYATQPGPLRTQLQNLLRDASRPDVEGDILAVVVPNTNKLSGGQIAAEVYSTLKDEDYDNVILIAPSHSGAFHKLTICTLDQYHTPFGDLPVNDKVRNELCDEDDDIFLDDTGHYHTEGVDVQLPFLQSVLQEGFDIVPIIMGNESPAYCKELGIAVGEVMYGRRTLIIATADVQEATEEAMHDFITFFESFDVNRLMPLLNSETVRMLGKGAVLVALIAAAHRHATHARVLTHTLPENGTPGFVGAVMYRA